MRAAADLDVEPAAILAKVPVIKVVVPCRSHLDTVMGGEVARVRRSPMAVKITGGGDHDRADGASERDTDHVALEFFAEPDPDIDPLADDVGQIVLDAQVESDFRVEPEKLRQDRLDEGGGGDTRRGDRQTTRGTAALLARLFERGVDLAQRRRDALEQLAACFGKADAPRVALEETHVEVLLQPEARSGSEPTASHPAPRLRA
jgi:hypothetical protein